MMLYVDKESGNDAICGVDISSTVSKCFIERNGRNIHGLSFDPASQLLFFTDTNERTINWISLEPGSKNNNFGNLLIKMDHGVPTDIAVDSCRGYVYNSFNSIPDFILFLEVFKRRFLLTGMFTGSTQTWQRLQ